MFTNKLIRYKRFISFFTSFSLLINSFFAPAFVIAQDSTPIPTEIVEQTQAPQETQGQIQEDEILVEKATPVPTVSAVPQATVTPTEALPQEESSVEVTVSNETNATNVDVQETILPESDLVEQPKSSSATLAYLLTTDKADYAPDEKVVITGSNFPINSQLIVKVLWPDGLERNSNGDLDQSDMVTTDEYGSFIFLYDLRGEGQEGQYLVEVLMGTTVLVTTTFTDSHAGPSPSGEITVNKAVDTNGDGVYEGGNVEANGLGFLWGISPDEPANLMGQTVSELGLGEYDVNENSIEGYTFTGWFFTTRGGSCAEPDGETLPAQVRVVNKKDTQVTLCNQRQSVTLLVNKVVDTNGDGTFNRGNTAANNLGFRWGLDAESPSRLMGTSVDVAPGEYLVTENDLEDYIFYGWYFGSEGTSCANSQGTDFPLLDVTENTEITLCNQIKTGTVEVHKLLDADGDGEYEEANDFANDLGFRWGADDEDLSRLMGSSASLPVGEHSLSENELEGYKVAGWYVGEPSNRYCQRFEGEDLPAEVEIVADETLVVTFCNKALPGKIGVNKLLDADGDGEYEEANDFANDLGFRWGLDSNEPGSLMGTSQTVVPGKYLVSENSMAGYELVGWFLGRPSDDRNCAEPDGTGFPESKSVWEKMLALFFVMPE